MGVLVGAGIPVVQAVLRAAEDGLGADVELFAGRHEIGRKAQADLPVLAALPEDDDSGSVGIGRGRIELQLKLHPHPPAGLNFSRELEVDSGETPGRAEHCLPLDPGERLGLEEQQLG